jgi:hypothetical protein
LQQASCSILHLPKDVFHQLLKIEDVTRQLSEEAKYYYDDCLTNLMTASEAIAMAYRM